MFQDNEDTIVEPTDISPDGSSCRHMFGTLVRVKKPCPQVKHLHWFHILPLVVLLAAQASCDETRLSIPSKNAVLTVYYVVVTVDTNTPKNESEIIAWLSQVFQNNLQNCVSSTTPTPPQTTSASTSNGTTPMTTTLQSYNTTTATATTMLQSNNTTSPATTTNTTTTTPATTTVINTTTTPATTTANTTTITSATTAINTTTPATTTTNTTTTTPAIITAINITTTPATTITNTSTTTSATTAINTTTPATTTTNTTTTTPATTTAINTTTTPATTTANTTTITTAITANNTTTTPATTTANTTTTTPATTTMSTITTTPATTTTMSTITTTPATTTTTTPAAATTTMSSTTTRPATTTTTTPAAATTTSSTTTRPVTTTTTTPAAATTTSSTTTRPVTTTTTTPAAATTMSSTTTRPVTTTTTTPAAATTTSSTTTRPATTTTTTPAAATTTSSTTTRPVTRTTTTPAAATTMSSTTTRPVTTTTTTPAAATTMSSTTTRPVTTTTTTPAAATTMSSTTTRPATTTRRVPPGLQGRPRPPGRRPSGSNRDRIAREIRERATETSVISKADSTSLLQGIEVSCNTKTAIRSTNCSVTLQLKRRVPSCCILRTLCAASKTSPDIHVVGKTADRTNALQDACSSNIQEKSSCVYTGPAGASCTVSGAAYVVPERNPSQCGAGNNTCGCSAYCNRRDAYYTFQISLQSSILGSTYVSSVISKLKQPNCTADDPCPLSAFAYADANVKCGSTATNLQICRVILGFGHEVPICNLSAAVTSLFQSEEDISYDGQVKRAAICGNSLVADNPLQSKFAWWSMDLNPAIFCIAVEDSYTLTCHNGTNLLLELDEQCVHQPVTTPSPNVTTAPPNATADSQANALLELTTDVSKLNSSQVAQLVSQLERLLSGPTVSLALGNTSVHIVSNLLGASPEVLSDSSNRIIGIVDTVGLKLVLDGTAETLLSPAVALSVKPADGSNFEETFFSISDPDDVQVRGAPRLRRSARANSSIPQGSIRLPPSLTQDLTGEQQQLASRVQFNFYQESTVYQDRSLGERRLNSGILGASVANLSITALQDDVVIHLRNMEPVPANFVATCVFWDFTYNNESGGWNARGCSVRNSTDNETVCACNHLTSFAILLDLSRDHLTSRVQATILTFITYIGCGISAIFLSITLLTYLAFGKLRKDIPSKILIQLCLALLLLNLVFLVDAWLALYPDAVGLCISTAWFLHYFLLVTFTWMGLEAVHMYLALVKVFNSHISHYMLKFSLVGWGVPMIVVIIVIAIDEDNYGLVSYGKFADGTSDEFCWLKNDIAFYVAVVAYFCLVFVFNLAMFAVVLVQLCRIKRQNPHNAQHRTTMQDLRSVSGIMILLGLTWGFAFFAWGPLNLPFMYLFAIFNSFQGFFIFVFYCAVKENVRKQWRTYLCCGRMRLAENSEWSRTATQKTTKKLSMTRLPSLHSSMSYQSNNSSNSSSFLVSDSSEQINGIGSPLDDRAITADEDPSTDVVLNEVNRQYRTQPAP